jgi:hypothetical protein
MYEDQSTVAPTTFHYGEHALEVSNDSLGRIAPAFFLAMYVGMVAFVLVVPFI